MAAEKKEKSPFFFIMMVLYIVVLYLGAQYDTSQGENWNWFCWKYGLIRGGKDGNSGLAMTSLMLVISIWAAVVRGWGVDKDIFRSLVKAKGIPITLYVIVTVIVMVYDWTGVNIPIRSNGKKDFWNAGAKLPIEDTQVIQDAHKALPNWLPDWIIPDAIGIPAPANWWFPAVCLLFLSMMLGLLGWSVNGTVKKVRKEAVKGFLQKETWVLLGILLLVGVALWATAYAWFIWKVGNFFGYEPGEDTTKGFVIFWVTNIVLGWAYRALKENGFFEKADAPANKLRKEEAKKPASNNRGQTHRQRTKANWPKRK